MSGHTSWFYEADTSSNPNNHPKGDFMVGDCPERPDNIAVCTGLDRARLLEAAPDLLKALIESRKRIIELCSAYSNPLPLASLERIDAAIAKATGAQP